MTPSTATPPTPAQARLAQVQAHLRAGGSVMLVTHLRATVYDPRHVDHFTVSASGADLYVRRGRSRDCLTLSVLRFSTLPSSK